MTTRIGVEISIILKTCLLGSVLAATFAIPGHAEVEQRIAIECDRINNYVAIRVSLQTADELSSTSDNSTGLSAAAPAASDAFTYVIGGSSQTNSVNQECRIGQRVIAVSIVTDKLLVHETSPGVQTDFSVDLAGFRPHSSAGNAGEYKAVSRGPGVWRLCQTPPSPPGSALTADHCWEIRNSIRSDNQ